MNLKIFSKALYSSWGYHYPTRTLFDCGEGCATALGNEIYGPERICLGHSNHGDHSLGLPSFIGCRNSGRGDKTKPLDIYAPESNAFTDLKSFINNRNPKLSYPLTYHEIKDNHSIIVNNRITIESFPVQHTYNSYGYKIMEKRNRLKADIDPLRAKELKDSGQDIYESYTTPIFVWLLDSFSFEFNHINQATHVVFDATFLSPKDRDSGETHASIEEVILWAKEFNVKRATLAHISTRYKEEEVINSTHDLITKINYNGKVDVIFGNKIYEI